MTSWTDYNKRIEFSTYDITSFIREQNAVAVVLGNGWACSGIMWGHIRKYYDVNNPCFIAEIEIEYATGEKQIIVTDKSWKANFGEILYNDIFLGEYIDKSKSLGNFSNTDYDDCGWGNVQIRETRTHLLVEQTSPKTVVKERLPLVFLHSIKGKDIYTTNQNMAGIIECYIKAESGTKIVFRYGEMLNKDGSLYTENLRSAEATDTYICNGKGIEKFRPLFTFHGFQYVEISVEGTAEIFDLNALVIYSDISRVGNFESSNELMNKIYSNVLWGQKGNFINIPTDCPQRDERLGWLGDIGVFARTACYQMDCKKFLTHYLSVVAESSREDGAIPCIAPIAQGFLDNAIGAAGWADAFLIVLSDLYDFYGEKEIIKQYLPYAERFLVWVENNSVDYRRQTYCFSDWLSINADVKEGYGDVDFQVFDLCFYAIDCLYMIRFYEILGLPTDIYEKKYSKAKEYFLNNLYKKGQIKGGGQQTALMLAYKAKLLAKEQIYKGLSDDIEQNGMTCGFIGVKYILPTLCEIGRSDLAYKLITSEKYPSWGYSVANGATTVWERWDSFTKENGFHQSGMNSFNHYSFGACVEWYYSHVLGIIPTKKNFEQVLIKPYVDFGGNVESVNGSYLTDKGVITVTWCVKDGYGEMKISVPKSIKFKVEIPNATILRNEYNEDCVLYSFRGNTSINIIGL